jgi:hypothetical protein
VPLYSLPALLDKRVWLAAEILAQALKDLPRDTPVRIAIALAHLHAQAATLGQMTRAEVGEDDRVQGDEEEVL